MVFWCVTGGLKKKENYHTNIFLQPAPQKNLRDFVMVSFFLLHPSHTCCHLETFPSVQCTFKGTADQTDGVRGVFSRCYTAQRSGKFLLLWQIFCFFICQRLIITCTFSSSCKELDILQAITSKHERRAWTCKPAGCCVLTPVMEGKKANVELVTKHAAMLKVFGSPAWQSLHRLCGRKAAWRTVSASVGTGRGSTWGLVNWWGRRGALRVQLEEPAVSIYNWMILLSSVSRGERSQSVVSSPWRKDLLIGES